MTTPNFTYKVPKDSTAMAIERLREIGFVVLVDALPRSPLVKIRERMDSDTSALLEYCDSIGGNPRARGHLQQGPPPTAGYVFKDIVMNRYVVSVCRALLGPSLTLTFYNGNTNCPNSVVQHLHMDSDHRSGAPNPVEKTFSVVVNIPLGPMNCGNGSIELWPGTHMIRSQSGTRAIADDQERSRRSECSPIQPITKIGDVLIRDIRLWHRGVPNQSNRPRHMIALVVVDETCEVGGKLRFQKGCETELEHSGIDSNALYVGEPIDYLLGPTRRIYEASRKT